VEPASATSLYAVKKLRDRGLIEKDAFRYHKTDETNIEIKDLEKLTGFS